METSQQGRPENTRAQLAIALLAGLCVFLLIGFSTRATWMEPPAARRSHVSRRLLHVRPWNQVVGHVDVVFAVQDSNASGRVVEARGWAASCSPQTPLAKVLLLVDGRQVGEATTFSPRPDVVDAYDRQDFAMSGWNISGQVEPLAPGEHSVILRAILANGKSHDIPGPVLSIK